MCSSRRGRICASLSECPPSRRVLCLRASPPTRSRMSERALPPLLPAWRAVLVGEAWLLRASGQVLALGPAASRLLGRPRHMRTARADSAVRPRASQASPMWQEGQLGFRPGCTCASCRCRLGGAGASLRSSRTAAVWASARATFALRASAKWRTHTAWGPSFVSLSFGSLSLSLEPASARPTLSRALGDHPVESSAGPRDRSCCPSALGERAPPSGGVLSLKRRGPPPKLRHQGRRARSAWRCPSVALRRVTRFANRSPLRTGRDRCSGATAVGGVEGGGAGLPEVRKTEGQAKVADEAGRCIAGGGPEGVASLADCTPSPGAAWTLEGSSGHAFGPCRCVSGRRPR